MSDNDKKKSSFKGVIAVIFVVLMCFGLTIWGIVYLTDKIFDSEQTSEKVPLKIPAVTADPDKGDILTFSSKPEKPFDNNISEPEEIQGENFSETQQIKESFTAVAEPVKPVAEPAKPVAEPVKPVVESAKPVVEPAKPTVKGGFVVQIMAVKNQTDAYKEAEKYKRVCPDIFVQKADLGEKGVWYRLRCGVSDSKEAAAQTRDMLKSAFKGISPQVVSNK